LHLLPPATFCWQPLEVQRVCFEAAGLELVQASKDSEKL